MQLALASASRRTLLDGIAWNFRQARSKRRDPNGNTPIAAPGAARAPLASCQWEVSSEYPHQHWQDASGARSFGYLTLRMNGRPDNRYYWPATQIPWEMDSRHKAATLGNVT